MVQLMDLPAEMLLEIVKHANDTSTYELPSPRILALSRTCRTLHAYASPYIARPISLTCPNGDCIEDSSLCPNELLEEISNLDQYFNTVRYFEFNLGLGQLWWPALAHNDPDGSDPLVPFCSHCDFVARRLVTYLNGPSPFPSLIGLRLDILQPECPHIPGGMNIISKLFRCPKLQFLHFTDAWGEGPLHCPQVPEHLQVSLKLDGYTSLDRMEDYYRIVPRAHHLSTALIITDAVPSAWPRTLRRIGVTGPADILKECLIVCIFSMCTHWSAHTDDFFVLLKHRI